MTAKPANPILLAAVKAEPAIVSAILAHRIAPKIDLDELDEQECSALGHLVQQARDAGETREAVAAMIKAGASVEGVEPDLDTRSRWDPAANAYRMIKAPLAMLALRRWNSPWKEVMQALGPKKLRALSGDWPLLHEAVARSNMECAEMLLGAGADPNREDSTLGLPISRCSTPAMFSLMVSSGAKLGLADSHGRTALQAVSSSNVSAEILSMAAQAAQAEARGSVASFKEGQASKAKAGDDIAQPLIEALFEAIDAKKRDRVKNLWSTLNLGRDKGRLRGARDRKGRTLLHAAISRANFALARLLIGRGLDVNEFDLAGNTPASLLLTLEHESRGDRFGDRRAKFYSTVAPLIDWGARAPSGADYFETLLAQGVETRNGVTGAMVMAKAMAPGRDWLETAPDGSSRLSRSLAKACAHGYRPIHSILAAIEESSTPFSAVLAEQAARPDFDAGRAKAVLEACLGGAFPRSPSQAQRRIFQSIETALGAFKATGLDPESVAWSAGLAEGAPTLAAAVESWRLEAVAVAAAAPKTRAKSL